MVLGGAHQSQHRHYNDECRPMTTSALLITPSTRKPSFQGTERPSKQDLISASQLSGFLIKNSPYSTADTEPSNVPSFSNKFSFSPDPRSWRSATSPNFRESDDDLHTPDPRRDKSKDMGGTFFTIRGASNVGCLAVFYAAMIGLFAWYPIASFFLKQRPSKLGGLNIGGTNRTGQTPQILRNFGLIDADTPKDARTKTSYIDGSTMELVFSDEFNAEGRSFYPGDDPYWEAVDLQYWQTGNLEWHDPAAITTKGDYLYITLSNISTHGLNYQSGMMNTWNKSCFTGGILEANVSLPGFNNIHGLWPAVRAMGNLGQAGYGASLEGTWPYSYDSCDVGTLPNQTMNGLPLAATENGDPSHDGVLSFLPGQRLSRCTCAGESHPGPMHSDGTYVGRSAPEIDGFEATVSYADPTQGQISQSAQWAPFNAEYAWLNTSGNFIIPDDSVTTGSPYIGGVLQQCTSSLTTTNQECYEMTGGCFSIYGFEYKPGFDDAYIGWIADDKVSWQLSSAGMGADSATQIGPRPVPQEPMYIILNLGISEQFGFIDFDNLVFPTFMRIDYVRVYQHPDSRNIGCDPADFPTAAYINQYLEAYTNPNLTTWRDDFKQPFPKNSLVDEC